MGTMEVTEPRAPSFEPADQALLLLGRELQGSGYRYITTTPASHRRVVERAQQQHGVLERVFGWSRSFARDELPSRILALLDGAGELEHANGAMRSGVRFSSLGSQLFVHSAFP